MKKAPDPDDDAGVRMFADLLAVAHEARPEALADDIIDATPSAARAIAEHPGSAFAIRCALEGYWRGGGLRYGFARKMSAGLPSPDFESTATPTHSPKPWRWSRGELLAADGERVISCSQAGDHECDRDGDELLIAAAPDLVEACRVLVAQLEALRAAATDARIWDKDDGDAIEVGRAALLKADVEP